MPENASEYARQDSDALQLFSFSLRSSGKVNEEVASRLRQAHSVAIRVASIGQKLGILVPEHIV
jgi:hypothetical protein